MATWSSEYVFESCRDIDIISHPWDMVVRAAWKKYPNPFNPSVVGIDVIDRKVNDRGILQSHRLMSTEWGLPDFAAKILGMPGFCYVSELSAVDKDDKIMAFKSRNILGTDPRAYVSEHSEMSPKDGTLVLRSKNLTFCNILTIEEYLKYSPHPKDKNKTFLQQEAKVTIRGVPFGGYLEKLVVDGMDKNAFKGRKAMEWVIAGLKTEAEPKTATKTGSNQLILQNLDTKLKKETEELKKSVDNLLTNASSQGTPL